MEGDRQLLSNLQPIEIQQKAKDDSFMGNSTRFDGNLELQEKAQDLDEVLMQGAVSFAKGEKIGVLLVEERGSTCFRGRDGSLMLRLESCRRNFA